MHISEVFASGFRCFGPANPLSIKLRRGLNVLVGPNDSGKTAVIDAFRHVLWTRGDDFIRLDRGDFHVQPNGEKVTELFIRCTFDGLLPDEEARFLEWCSNEAGTLRLHVCLRATLRKLAGGGSAVITQYRSSKNGDGPALEGDLREYLKATYLKPLRDAERELHSGRRSRLSRILGALPAMAPESQPAQAGAPQTLRDTMREADANVEMNPTIQEVQNSVNTTYLNEVSFVGDPLSASLGLGVKGSFDQLLERLELYLNPPPGQTERLVRGLGYNNLLFMAAELLLLQSHHDQVPFLLIEEPEAHLHPQHQTLFMQSLEARTATVPEGERGQQVQVVLSTHSSQLAASADLDSMVMVIEHRVYPLARGHTLLQDDDYAFLRRFLDATKANLFFARALVIVEGDAENILLPALAKKMGRPFGKHGVSIVKVGHRGLFRYSRILRRRDSTSIPVRVALIPDRDIPPEAAKKLIGQRKTESEWNEGRLRSHIENLTRDDGGCVKSFPSEQWTLEYDLARNPDFAPLVYQAIKLAKGATGKTRQEIADAAKAKVAAWQAGNSKSADEVAVLIFAPLFIRSRVSKAEVAQQLSQLVDELPDDARAFRALLPRYLVNAIDYVTSSQDADAAGGQGGNPAAEA